MLIAVGISIYMVQDSLLAPGQNLINYIVDSDLSQIFFFDDANSPKYFVKQFLAGASITIAMTGLDQDMMQKNLTCKSLKDAQKNMYWFSISLVVVNLFFLALGLLLTDFAAANNFAASGDQLFPMLALQGGLSAWVGFFFIIGLIAAAYSSADSALTALTTSFSVDFLGLDKKNDELGKRTRKKVHIGFSLVLLVVIVLFKYVVSENVIKDLFMVAGYTYGPLLGMFFFGLFTKFSIKDKMVPIVAIASPILTFLLSKVSVIYAYYAIVPTLNCTTEAWQCATEFAIANYYQFGFEVLLINGTITFLGLLFLMQKKK
jgi:Na+/proline symporter